MFEFVQIETSEIEDHCGDGGSEEVNFVDRTGTRILKPLIIHQICVEVNVIIQYDILLCDVTFVCKFMSEQRHRKW